MESDSEPEIKQEDKKQDDPIDEDTSSGEEEPEDSGKKRKAVAAAASPAKKKRKVSPVRLPKRHKHFKPRGTLREFISKKIRRNTARRLCRKGGAIVQSEAATTFSQYALYSLVADITRRAAVCARMRGCVTITPDDVVLGALHSTGIRVYPCVYVDKKKKKPKEETKEKASSPLDA